MHAQPVLVSTLKFDELLVSSWRDWREGVYAGTGSLESHQDWFSIGFRALNILQGYNIVLDDCCRSRSLECLIFKSPGFTFGDLLKLA